MVRHGRWLYLFMSAGDYARCSYSTVWRRSRSLVRWRGKAQRTLLAKRSTGLCGPGGADVVVDRHRVRLYFHGWTCRAGRPCTNAFHKARWDRGPVRALYGARLRFSRRGVTVGSFVRPHPRHVHGARHHGARHHGALHHGARHHGKKHRKHRRHHVRRHQVRHHVKHRHVKHRHQRHVKHRHQRHVRAHRH
jgi:hypothetical protein